MIALILACTAIALIVGYSVASYSQGSETANTYYNSFAPQQANSLTNAEKIVRIRLPAVDTNNVGSLVDLSVREEPGEGQVFFRIDQNNPLIDPDTQTSLRTALTVAKRLTGKSIQGENIFYDVETESMVVGGQSAGAAATIATMALLNAEQLRSDTIITGTIQEDGSIGPVGKVLEKAVAAKAAGYNTILVPAGESTETVLQQQCTENNNGNTYVRECNSVPVKENIQEQTGLKVIEVSNVQTAYSLMRKP